MLRHDPSALDSAGVSARAKKYSLRFIAGTLSNFISTISVLPLQYIWTSKQDPRKSQDYLTSIREVSTLKGLKRVYSASGDVLKLAPKQSVSYLGVSNIVLDHYHNEPIYSRGFKAGLASALFESLFTTRDIHQIVAKWCHYENPPLKFGDIRHMRCLQVTLMRNVIANPLTFINVFYAKHLMNQYFYPGNKSAPAHIAACAGMAGSIFTATMVAPLVLLQTYTMRNPSQSVRYHFNQIINQPWHQAWRGNAGRAVSKGVQGLITFGLLNVGNRIGNQFIEQAPAEIHAKKPEL